MNTIEIFEISDIQNIIINYKNELEHKEKFKQTLDFIKDSIDYQLWVRDIVNSYGIDSLETMSVRTISDKQFCCIIKRYGISLGNAMIFNINPWGEILINDCVYD